ncbi:MAG: hypothetical protein JO312_03235 [Hyphomicrobiales bacterium]|nr:hypothetical protein [Hyphomicrobiales bacterium]
MSRMHLALCAAGALLMLTGFGWANSVGDTPWQRPLQVFSFDFGDQAQAGDLGFGASGPADLSATTEEDEDGIYDRFADQIGDILAVEPASDRFSWAILLIAFAGMTAAASGRRRPRRTTISI